MSQLPTSGTHRYIPVTSRLEWDEALAGVPHGFGHTWASCHAAFLNTGYPTYLFVCDVHDGKSVCPFSERTHDGCVDISTPRGFGGFAGVQCDAVTAHWNEFVQARQYVCGYIGLPPPFAKVSSWPPNQLFRERDMYLLDLRRGVDVLFAGMSANRRRQLRTYETSRISYDHPDSYLFLVKHANRFLQRRNASAASFMTDDALRALISSAGVMVTSAHGISGDPVAVSAFGYTADAADYLFNISLEGHEASATPLLWAAVLKLSSMSIPVLNLGGGASYDGDGVSEFKRRFGSRVVPFYSLRQVFDHAKFHELCVRAGRHAGETSGYFPQFRQAPVK